MIYTNFEPPFMKNNSFLYNNIKCQ